MTRDDVIATAKEAGIFKAYSSDAQAVMYESHAGDIERFASLVAAKEREACAAICKVNGDEWTTRNPRRQHHTGAGIGALACYEAIRARGQKTQSATVHIDDERDHADEDSAIAAGRLQAGIAGRVA